jgi:hypothetical protein
LIALYKSGDSAGLKYKPRVILLTSLFYRIQERYDETRN